MKRAQLSSLAAGLAVTLLGVVLFLQEEGTLNLAPGWLLAALSGLAGAALVASGMGARDP